MEGDSSKGSRSGLSFSEDTDFSAKGRPAPTSNKRKKAGREEDDEVGEQEVEEEVPKPINKCVCRVFMKVPKCNSPGKMTNQLLIEGLKKLQVRDKSVVYYCESDGSTAAKLSDLPEDFTDVHDRWSSWIDGLHSWKPTIREGKTRTYKGAIVILCSMDPMELFHKTMLSMENPIPGIRGAQVCLSYK